MGSRCLRPRAGSGLLVHVFDLDYILRKICKCVCTLCQSVHVRLAALKLRKCPNAMYTSHDTDQVRARMLYASSRDDLKNKLGSSYFAGEFYCNDKVNQTSRVAQSAMKRVDKQFHHFTVGGLDLLQLHVRVGGQQPRPT